MSRMKKGESPLVVGMRLLLGIGRVATSHYTRVMKAFERVEISVQLDRVQLIATAGVSLADMMSFFSESVDLADLLLFIGQHTEAWGEQWQGNVLASVSLIMGDVKFSSALDAYKEQVSTLEDDGPTTKFSGKLLETIQFVDSMKVLEQSQPRPAKRRLSPLSYFSQGVATESDVFGAGYPAHVGVFGGGHCQPIDPSSHASGQPLAKRVKNP